MLSIASANHRDRPVEAPKIDGGLDEQSDSDVSASELTGDERNHSAGSNGDLDSDSDSLDSASPRKRRRTSPTTKNLGADQPEIPFVKSTFNVPSRVKRAQETQGQRQTKQADASLSDSAPGVTAPLHADTTFDSLGVRPWLVHSLANMAIKRPTGIQKASIPEILNGRDCIGGSRTGSGKTVAFAVPILQKWAENPSAIFAVVLTPTRYVFTPEPRQGKTLY